MPTEGKIEFQPKWRAAVLKEAGLYPEPFNGRNRSIGRHCYTSYAYPNLKILKRLGLTGSAQTYWIDKCGHEFEVFKTHYKRELPSDECEKIL